MENIDLLTEKSLPQVRRHRAKMLRSGVSQDGGMMLVGTFDKLRFAVREKIDPEPYIHLGRVPPVERPLRVYLASDAPPEIGSRVVAFVKHLDPMGRPVEVQHDDDGLRAVEQKVLWRWRLWVWIRRMLG